MGIILGLAAAFCWGVADFSARFASRRAGAYRTLFYMQCFSLVVLTSYLKFTGGIARGVAPGWRPWALAAGVGVLNVFASLSLYHSFEVGVMSIVAPISASYPALTVALSLLSGEKLIRYRGPGLAITFIGVILAATSFANSGKQDSPGKETVSRIRLSPGVIWAIFSAVGFGVMFWFVGFYVIPVVGSITTVWVLRLTAMIALAITAIPARQSLKVPFGSVWWLFALVGLMDTTAFVANNLGFHIGPVSVVSVLASLYGAVTVLLSWIFLRERLERTQWLGIFLVFIGVILVSL